MATEPALVIEVARGGAVDRQLSESPPRGDVAVVLLPADAAGRIDAPDAGEVVLSVLSPEALARDPDDVRRAIGGAGSGDEPLVVVVEAAEELREDELAVVVDAASRSSRTVILRVIADA
jgi:hypothetical protein